MIAQKYKFFVNNKVVILCDNPGRIDEILDHEQHFIIEKYEASRLKKVLQVLNDTENESPLILFSKDVEQLKQDFLTKFECIEAAGGLIQNREQAVLLIYRREFWDMPKGKRELGESLEETALREVQEETGLGEMLLGDRITFKGYLNQATYHSYPFKGKQAMKISHWFRMTYQGESIPIPQTEEDIEEIRWVKVEDLPKFFSRMYPSIQDVLKEVFAFK